MPTRYKMNIRGGAERIPMNLKGGTSRIPMGMDSVMIHIERDYNKLINQPSVNNEVLEGNKTFEDLGDHTMTNIEIKAIFDRVFKGGN